MNYRRPSFLRTLLLLLALVVGPVQAQTAYACNMMDTVMLDECCCEAHVGLKDCADSNCDAIVEPGGGVCCDRSVEVSFDNEARQDLPAVNLGEVRSDVDPPPAILFCFDSFIQSQSLAAPDVFLPQPGAADTGSDIYLITQRQRI